MSFKKHLIFLAAGFFLFIANTSAAQEEYDPPFQISGVVKEVNEDTLKVYLPYINKHVIVLVSSETEIINRMRPEDSAQGLSSIDADDLVVINGVLQGESFCSENISFLPSYK